MLRLCRVDISRTKEALERIEKYKRTLIGELRPSAIILFGSFARGDINQGSDVDIAVIADFKEGFLDRIKLLLDLNDGIQLPLEPVGYTPDEFKKMADEANPFILEILDKGKVIYGKVPYSQSFRAAQLLRGGHGEVDR
jgi:predicted nucleotidyltransferase